MKKIFSLTLVLALMAALFTGCGCANVSTHPGGMITEEATRPSVMPTPTATHETTRPTDPHRPEATRPIPPATASEPTTQSPMDTTGAATTPTDTTMDARHRTRNTDR